LTFNEILLLLVNLPTNENIIFHIKGKRSDRFSCGFNLFSWVYGRFQHY